MIIKQFNKVITELSLKIEYQMKWNKFTNIYAAFVYLLRNTENPAYVAVAISKDNQMGDDSVMECVPEGGQIRAYTSWTTPRPSLGVTRNGVVSIRKFYVKYFSF